MKIIHHLKLGKKRSYKGWALGKFSFQRKHICSVKHRMIYSLVWEKRTFSKPFSEFQSFQINYKWIYQREPREKTSESKRSFLVRDDARKEEPTATNESKVHLFDLVPRTEPNRDNMIRKEVFLSVEPPFPAITLLIISSHSVCRLLFILSVSL